MTNITLSNREHKIVLKRDSPKISLSHQIQKITIKRQGFGPSGPGGGDSDKNFEQEFSATDFISVIHNLNKKPSVTVVDSAGTEVVGDITHLNNNQLTVSFTAAFGGRIICN